MREQLQVTYYTAPEVIRRCYGKEVSRGAAGSAVEVAAGLAAVVTIQCALLWSVRAEGAHNIRLHQFRRCCIQHAIHDACCTRSAQERLTSPPDTTTPCRRTCGAAAW